MSPLPAAATHLVVMGVSGAGKTTVGRRLASDFGLPFFDADDLHSRANIDKMRAGVPLSDADRWPWLEEVGRTMSAHAAGAVTACSALRRTYRDVIREFSPSARFIHLHADVGVLQSRIQRRADHFMPASLLWSQLTALEPLQRDELGVTWGVEKPVDSLINLVRANI
ncbi:MAG TPA: gluconokinase [Pseudolysinimonas sp.]|nr:gluconokinase [Pseudolysinimonas sp.]